MSAIPPTLAYRTPPPLRRERLPWNIALVAWTHVALSGVMVVLARQHVDGLKRDLFAPVTITWGVTMIISPLIAGGAVLLGQRRFAARLVAAICVVPLVLAELLLGVYGLILVSFAHLAERDKGTRLMTIGIACVAAAALLLGLTAALIRYISKPCPRSNTAILPS